MNKATITLKSNLSNEELHSILESIFWDGEYFEELEEVEWSITE